MKKIYMAMFGMAVLFVVQAVSLSAGEPTRPMSWTAQDALGRKIGTAEQYGETRGDKTVGIFFCIWHGAHGYDHMMERPDGGVVIPSPADSLSPFDVQKIEDADPVNPKYGPLHTMHHWGEPYLGYYVADDEWIIRKHAQMLTDAGVDMIMLDLTNNQIYMPILLKICEVYTKMRAEGSRTPQISGLVFTNAKERVEQLYTQFYEKGLYSDLWFRWKGKPLIFAPFDAMTEKTADFFTVRQCWYNTHKTFNDAFNWFGDGKDRCSWADIYPQNYGWHDSPDRAEMISVSPATHPIETAIVPRIGRSYHNGAQPPADRQPSGEGLFFIEQFDRAMEVDPEFILFSGWNEWTMMRFLNVADNPSGHGIIQREGNKMLKEGDSYFVDLYNHEFSRDLEPLRGDFGDNYYYQMADFIRRFKGVEPQAAYSKTVRISLDDMSSWDKAEAVYTDDRGDTFHRDHFGYGRLGKVGNSTGRNDIVLTKVASDGDNLYFYAETDQPLTPHTDAGWMRLFIDVKGSGLGDWEGFQYMVDGASNAATTTLSRSLNRWDWARGSDISYRVDGKRMVVAIPMSELGITDPDSFAIDFKWIDNAVGEGDIQECLTDGDSAPNGRFRYRYEFER